MTEINKGGRPCGYVPEMTEKVWQLVNAGGANLAQICAALKIGSFSTFYAYREKFPEFREATDMCKMASCATLEGALMEGAIGEKKIDSKAAMWMLYNKDKDHYQMPGKVASTEQNINIKIGNINVANLSKMSSLELDRLLHSTEQSIRAIEIGQMPELESVKTIEHEDNE